jgi:hypothetical protein
MWYISLDTILSRSLLRARSTRDTQHVLIQRMTGNLQYVTTIVSPEFLNRLVPIQRQRAREGEGNNIPVATGETEKPSRRYSSK